MLTKTDITQIQKALKPQFDSLESKISSVESNLRSEIKTSEHNLKEFVKVYVQESADAILNGVEKMFESRDLPEDVRRKTIKT